MEKDQNTTHFDEGNKHMAHTKIASKFGWMYMLVGPLVTFALVSFFRGNISSVIISIFAFALIAILNNLIKGEKPTRDSHFSSFEHVPLHIKHYSNPHIVGTPAYLSELGRKNGLS